MNYMKTITVTLLLLIFYCSYAYAIRIDKSTSSGSNKATSNSNGKINQNVKNSLQEIIAHFNANAELEYKILNYKKSNLIKATLSTINANFDIVEKCSKLPEQKEDYGYNLLDLFKSVDIEKPSAAYTNGLYPNAVKDLGRVNACMLGYYSVRNNIPLADLNKTSTLSKELSKSTMHERIIVREYASKLVTAFELFRSDYDSYPTFVSNSINLSFLSVKFNKLSRDYYEVTVKSKSCDYVYNMKSKAGSDSTYTDNGIFGARSIFDNIYKFMPDYLLISYGEENKSIAEFSELQIARNRLKSKIFDAERTYNLSSDELIRQKNILSDLNNKILAHISTNKEQ